MRFPNLSFAAASLAIFCCPAVGLARKLEHWPYERLFQEAELVVIATVVATTPCGDQLQDEGTDWQADFQAVNTTFAVKTVLKGQPRDTLKLLHFRYHPDTNTVLENGPQFASFLSADNPVRLRMQQIPNQQPKSQIKQLKAKALAVKSVSIQPPPSYMLFLKLRSDGRFEPLSGQIDSKLSVRDLWMHGVLTATNGLDE